MKTRIKKLYKEMLYNFKDECVSDYYYIVGADENIHGRRNYILLAVNISNQRGYSLIYDMDVDVCKPDKIVGKNVVDTLSKYDYLKYPVLDSYCSSLTYDCNEKRTLILPSNVDSKQDIVTNEIVNICLQNLYLGNKILSFGYFSYLKVALEKAGFNMDYVDKNINDTGTFESTSNYNIVLISASGVLDESIFDALEYSRKNNCVTVIIAQTASSLLPKILKGSLVYLVCQKFPFWFIEGNSLLHLITYK